MIFTVSVFCYFQFSIVETVLTGILDEFPALKKTKLRTILFRGGACAFGFLMGLPMTTGVIFPLLLLFDVIVPVSSQGG